MKTSNLHVIALIIVVLVTGCGQSQGGAPVQQTAEIPATTPSGTVLLEIPEILDPETEYLIYLHGAIIEEQGMKATHPQFGTYDYTEILQAFADRGFTVIAEAGVLQYTIVADITGSLKPSEKEIAGVFRDFV